MLDRLQLRSARTSAVRQADTAVSWCAMPGYALLHPQHTANKSWSAECEAGNEDTFPE